MDPMTELFYDESNNILQELRRGIVAHKGMSVYDQEVVQSVFRCIHTLKASSTMMLYENLSELSKAFERLLFCFRGEGKTIADTQRFDDILVSYLEFFERETDKLPAGKQPEDRAEELEEKIKSYTEDMTQQMGAEEAEAYQEKISEPKKRQVYYIAGTTEEEGQDAPSEEKKRKEIAVQSVPEQKQPSYESEFFSEAKEKEEEKEEEISDKSQKRYVILENKREMIFQGIRNLQRVISTLEYSIDESGVGEITTEQIERLREIEKDFLQVKKHLTKADFVPVAKKMEIVVDEMSAKLGKQVRLLVKGENTPVDFDMREKISNALIHIVRNAVDHGIEDIDERERLGKAPVGLIKLKFATEDGHLKISVKDDGRGIDTDGILKNAEEQGFLDKSLTDYTSDEIYQLMLESGVTTTEIPNDYSGRGVGMDVIAHTVEELGGKLKITSRPEEGTTITMKF